MSKEVIYASSEEKYVNTYVVYADSDDGNVFYEKEKKTKIPKADLMMMFAKGMLVFYEDTYFKPVSYKESGGSAAITVLGDSINYTFNSAEHA